MEPVSELRRYYEILRRHVAIIALVATLAVVGVAAQVVNQARQYQAEVSMLITPQIFASSSPDDKPDLAAFQSEYRGLVINDILYLAKSSEVLHRVADRIGTLRVRDVFRAVTPRSIPNTDILLITAKDTQPARAALVANATAQELVKYYVQLNRAAAASTRKFIGEQVKVTQAKLHAAEEALRAFQTRTRIVNLPDVTSRMIQRSFDLQAQYSGALVEEQAAQTRVAAIRQRLRSENDRQLASVEISTNPVVGQLRDRLVAAEADLAGLRQVYTDQHPKVQEALGKVVDLRARLRHEASKALVDQSLGVSPLRDRLVQELVSGQVDATVARARADAIDPILGQMQAALGAMPANELTFARLQRDVKVNEEIFARLSSLYQDALVREQRAGSSGQAGIVIVDKAAASPVSRQLPQKAGLAGLLGLLVGCALALLVDNLDNRVRSPREAEGTYGVPVLASVPTMGSQTNRVLAGASGVASLVLPFLFVILAGLLVGVLVSKAAPVVGGLAGQAGVVYGRVTAAVVALLLHLPHHMG